MERRFRAENERRFGNCKVLMKETAEPYSERLAGRTTGNNGVAAALAVPRPRPSWLPVSVWPFETLSIDTTEGEVAFTDVGRGPVLLFVHTGFWSFVWRDIILRLAPEFRCGRGLGRHRALQDAVICLIGGRDGDKLVGRARLGKSSHQGVA